MKSGLISCMLHRAKMIYLNDNLFLKEVNQLKSLFLVNDFISKFFDKAFRKFIVKDHSLPDQFLHDSKKDTDFEKYMSKFHI